jgi:hypothetical protein
MRPHGGLGPGRAVGAGSQPLVRIPPVSGGFTGEVEIPDLDLVGADPVFDRRVHEARERIRADRGEGYRRRVAQAIGRRRDAVDPENPAEETGIGGEELVPPAIPIARVPRRQYEGRGEPPHERLEVGAAGGRDAVASIARLQRPEQRIARRILSSDGRTLVGTDQVEVGSSVVAGRGASGGEKRGERKRKKTSARSTGHHVPS